MFSTIRWTPLLAMSLLLALLAVTASCGGSDDSSDGDGDSNGDSPGGSSSSQGSPKNGKLPKIEDAVYSKGTIHVEITGDKRSTIDTTGNGIAQGGLLLLTYGDSEASSFLTFTADEPGGIAVTTKQFATAGGWDKDCSFKFDKSGTDQMSGEFECKSIEAVDTGAAKAYRVTLKGKFSVER